MTATPDRLPPPVPMKKWRTWLVLGLVVFLVAGHAVDILALKEHWPFSYYPMYARAEKKKRTTLLSLMGLMRAPGYRAMVRITDAKYVPPLGEGRLRVILMAAYGRGDKPQNIENTRRVMLDYMREYEARRIAGLHDGPSMRELWLYRLTWRHRPDGTLAEAASIKEPLMVVKLHEIQPEGKAIPTVETPPEVEPE